MAAFIAQYGIYITAPGMVILGVLAIYGLFDRKKRALRKEEEQTGDRVMVLMRAEVTELTKKVNTQQKDIVDLNEKVDRLVTENKTLKDVLQGRDDQSKKFYQDAYAAMEVIKHNDKVSEENAKILSKIATLLETVVKLNK